MVNKVKIIQKLAIINNNEVLILKRSISDPSRPNTWDLPGGNVDDKDNVFFDGNILYESLSRELSEEVGIKLELKNFEVVCVNSSYNKIDKNMVIWLGYKLVLDYEIEVRISSEHSEYKWVTFDEFSDLDFGFAKNDFLKLLERLK